MDKLDDLRDWQYLKDKDVQHKSVQMQKEIMLVAKAKDMSEKEVWQMGMMEYFQALAVLESYNRDIENSQKQVNTND